MENGCDFEWDGSRDCECEVRDVCGRLVCGLVSKYMNGKLRMGYLYFVSRTAQQTGR